MNMLLRRAVRMSSKPFMGRAMMSAEAAPVGFFFLLLRFFFFIPSEKSRRHTSTRQQMKTFKIYRYDPDSNKEPELQEYKLDLNEYVIIFFSFFQSFLAFIFPNPIPRLPSLSQNRTHGTGRTDQN